MPSNSPGPETPFDGTLPLGEALELAIGLHKSGLVEAADELYRRILASAPDHVDALHFLGLACHQQGRREEALTLVRRAVSIAPAHGDALNNLGNMLLEQDLLPEAYEAYERVLRLRPDHADAHSNVGTVFRRRGDLARAEVHFRRAVEIDPTHGIAHHNLGCVVRDTGRSEEALEWFRRSLVLSPYDGESYRRIGATLYSLGRVSEAGAIYARWAELEPQNPLARHLLAGCGGGDAPPRASDAFLQRTFDPFADSFDGVLARLQYRVPELVADAVTSVFGAPEGSLVLLDAGAGTGLCGPSLRPFAARLIGVDLSKKMLAKAAIRGVYDALEAAELTAYMRRNPATFDVVISADTMVYFGALADVFAAVAIALRPGGTFICTLEELRDGGALDHRLNPSGRYSHAEAYLRSALSEAGLSIVAFEKVNPRLENQVPVAGILITARLNPSASPAAGASSRRPLNL